MKIRTLVISTMACVVAVLVGLVNFKLDTMAPSLPARVELHESWAYGDSATRSTQSCAPLRTGALIGAIDKGLKELPMGNIAYNVPSKIRLGDTAIIELILGLESTIDELQQMIEAVGEKYGARIQVSNLMEASLSGPHFAITVVTPEMQAVTRTDITKWKWEIEPKSAGSHNLHLTLSVLIYIEGESVPRMIRTFDKKIEVKVTWYKIVGLFITNNWKDLYTIILIPVGGGGVIWIIRNMWRSMRKKKKSKPSDK